MRAQMHQRRGTAAAWATKNPTDLAEGEMGYETDTGRFKFGDGTTAWNDLPYAGGAPSEQVFHRPLVERLSVAASPATITVGAAPDPAYTRSYSRGTSATPPADWPVDNGMSTAVSTNGYEHGVGPGVSPSLVTRRFMCDADRFAMYVIPEVVGTSFVVYIDGVPQGAPSVFTAGGEQLVTVVLPSGSPRRPRLIEIVGEFYLAVLYTARPGSLWRPSSSAEQRVLVVGDSYVQPSVMDDPNGVLPQKPLGIYQGIAPLLGLTEVMTDGRGGTGYLAANTGAGWGNYRSRVGAVAAYEPDVLVFHGGGANDLFSGHAVGAVVTQAVATLTEARAALPDARLVFVEGFAPPGFTPSTFNPAYVAVRQGVQAAFSDAYYIDVATTDPWIKGSGNTAAPGTDGENSAIYVGNDGVHLTRAGHAYVRGRMAEPLRRILNDDGALLGTLVR